jgi:putative FmdB family regulatory protein
MTIYEYTCESCGQVSEILVHNYSDPEKPVCSNCGSTEMHKIMSAPSFLKENLPHGGKTCCGRTERCETPPCSSGRSCCHG